MRVGPNAHVVVESLFQSVRDNKLNHYHGRLTASLLFMTPSVRTRTSFQRACYDLGINVINVTEQREAESFRDFGYALGCVSDFCVARTADKSQRDEFADGFMAAGGQFVIDAGTGTSSHPTQALADLYTIRQSFKKSHIKVSMCGSKNNRAYQSFKQLVETQDWIEVREDSDHNNADVVHCTTFGNTKVLPDDLECKIIHPFPRGETIPKHYDYTEQDLYHDLMKNLIPIRRAILQELLR